MLGSSGQVHRQGSPTPSLTFDAFVRASEQVSPSPPPPRQLVVSPSRTNSGCWRTVIAAVVENLVVVKRSGVVVRRCVPS